MPPKQATLGRFFTLPAGTKPPVQQQTKLRAPKKDVVKEEEKDSSDKDTAESDNEALTIVKDEEGDAVMAGTPEAEEEAGPAKKKKVTPVKENKASKKRKSAKPVEEEPEPVTKRGKHLSTPKSPAKGKKPTKEAEAPKENEPVVKSEPEDDDEPVTKRSKRSAVVKSPKKVAPASRGPEASSDAEERDDQVTKRSKRPTAVRSPKKVAPAPKELEASSEAEGEDDPITKRSKRSTSVGTSKKAARASKEPETSSEAEGEDNPVAKPNKRPTSVRTPKKVARASKEPMTGSEAEGEDSVTKPSKRSTTTRTPKKAAQTPKKSEELGAKESDVMSEAEDSDEVVAKPSKRPTTTKSPKKAVPTLKEPKKSPKKAPTLTELMKRGQKPKALKKKAEESEPASEEEDDEPVAKRGRKPTSKKSGSPKAESPKKKAGSLKKDKAKSAQVEESDEGSKSAAEEEVEVGSDDGMKPALAEKARKVVAKQLSGKAPSHPFPDWDAGSPTPYGALVTTFTLAEGTTKRLEKLSHASLFLRQVLRLTPDDLLMVIHLMINRLAADYEGVELGIGESLIMKAIGESCGRTMDKIREDQNEIGDLGMVAMKSRSKQRTLFPQKPLTIKSVHQGLLEIATVKGEGGQGRKVAGIKKLLAAAKGDEAKYLVRGLEGKLRTGLAENTVIVALSQAIIVHEMEKKGQKASVSMLTEAELKLRSVFSELPSYDVIIPAMMEHGIMKLKDVCKLQPGVPLKPMLAKPTKAISEVLDRFENKRFTCEYKYDGERAQIHFVSPDSSITYPATSISATTSPTKGITKIFSRNSEDLSKKYPDILAVLDKWVNTGVESFVLDCEAVAWDKEEKRVLPFQQLMTRKRKDVKIEDVKVKVCVFAFDLLFLNGKSLCQETLEERRRLMHESFSEIEGEFTFATYADANDLEQIQVFLDESVKASCEGLMVKMLDGEESGYEPSKRSRNWLKVKKDYLAGVGDSLDLVVLGAYHGRGKRTGGYGAFLLACYNPSTQNYESICNIGTGFSEANLEEFHTLLSELEIEKPKPYYSHDNGNKQQPDVWFEPKVVWEVKTADLSLSPVYKAAAGMADDTGKGRGISLRFPRFIRVRDDKSADDATTNIQVADMYKRQEVVTGAIKKSSKGVDDDFEY